ncbi:FecR domain-containing protein [Sphingomonas sp.]|uniref:FecR family protein n=1 Tax=Sphingomonas sp. TaxID=28214 RepID=UPI001B146B31|nr:FecR domain-containing protein [Sphingomonas sp.]MBO9713312.1 FecR domain-containing protein [Sphingomonas sp.]
MMAESAARIEDAAARWAAQIDGEGWNAEREAELARWLAGDPRHAGALLQAQAAWEWLGGAATEQAPEDEADPRPIRDLLTRRRLLVGGGALAASIAAVMLLPPGTDYATKLGEIRRVPLPDGSLAAINTSSRIEVAATDKLRRIVLAEGEAWFQVAKDAERPFVVEAGAVRVRATGTAFSVRRREGGADIYVTEGTVEVTTIGGGAAHPVSAGAGLHVADDATAQPLAHDSAAIDRVLAWRSGEIALDGRSLASAVAEFNRYNARQIVVRDPVLLAEQLDGTFRTDDPVEFAQAVHGTFATPVDLSDPNRIVIGR